MRSNQPLVEGDAAFRTTDVVADDRGRLAAILVFFLAVGFYLPGVWRIPFASEDEPLEALVVWEMSRSGDWILPRRNGEEIPAKPPLYHWIALPFAKLSGEVDETSARLPSVICAALTVAMVFAKGGKEWGSAAGWIAALALATSPQWVRWAIRARTDATFVLFSTLAFFFAAAWLRSGRDLVLALAAAASGSAVLAKGPAGIVLPGLVLASEIWRRGLWNRLRARPLALAGVTFAVITGSWYAAALVRGGSDFFVKQILAENVFRFLPSEEGGPSRDHPIFFYVPDLLLGMAPWSLVLVPALLAVWRERRDPATEFARYCATWFTVVFLICSLASGKRSNYLLPLYPAAALLIGRTVAASLRYETPRLLRYGAGLLAVGLAVMAVVLASWALGLEPWRPVLPFLHQRDRASIPLVAAQMTPGAWLPIACALCAAALVFLLIRRAWRPLAAAFAAIVLGTVLAVNLLVLPAEARVKTLKGFAHEVSGHVAPGDPLFFYRRPRYEVLFYLSRHVPVQRGSFEASARGWAIVTERDWLDLPTAARARGEVVAESGSNPLGRPESRLLLVRLR